MYQLYKKWAFTAPGAKHRLSEPNIDPVSVQAGALLKVKEELFIIMLGQQGLSWASQTRGQLEIMTLVHFGFYFFP